jgi:SagB-type dehydrogenase family enzyme
VQGRARRLTGGYAERSNGLWGALSRRRTVRAFDRRSISSVDLASLLLWTWGRTRSYNGSRLDRRILKTSPSGGARHPIEVYPVVQRVAGIAPGVYHHSVERHAMVLVRAGRREREMEDLFSGQAWAKDCAALFLMTAVLARSMWKYDFSRAYRVLHLDAGHLGQTLHLVATELGLGVFTTAALQDRRIESLLGLDGVDEVVLYAGGVGHARAR